MLTLHVSIRKNRTRKLFIIFIRVDVSHSTSSLLITSFFCGRFVSSCAVFIAPFITWHFHQKFTSSRSNRWSSPSSFSSVKTEVCFILMHSFITSTILRSSFIFANVSLLLARNSIIKGVFWFHFWPLMKLTGAHLSMAKGLYT